MKIYIVDTSALLSGKFIDLQDGHLVTTISIEKEITSGGKDYRNLQFLISKGISMVSAEKNLIKKIIEKAKETGDFNRLSSFDIEILALALNYKMKGDESIILTDDYSIQNLANYCNIKYKSISQKGITKNFKWIYRCRGCGKKFKDNISICPICGTETKKVIASKDKLKK